MTYSLGIRREGKSRWERRVPLSPQQVGTLLGEGLSVVIQPSPNRIFSDEEYRLAGAKLDEDLSGCNAVFGVKEMPVDLFRENGTYAFFSHTIKGQPYNMEMLNTLMAKRCHLIDYETVTDEAGRRLIFFGRFAGLAGMLDSLWAFGRRLEHEGLHTPFGELRPAFEYDSLEEAKDAIRALGSRIKAGGLPEKLAPLIVGFTGYGNVSLGAQEILSLLPVQEVSPGDLLAGAADAIRDRVVKVVLKEADTCVPRDPTARFDLQHYFGNPALEDVANVPVRPKTESYDQQLLVIAQIPRSISDRELSIRQVSIVFGRDYLLTFQEGREDALEPVRKRLKVQNSLMRKSSSDYLGYAILDTTVDAYYPVVESMGTRIEELEERVLADASPETLRELNSVKGQLLALRRAITPQREAVNKLIRDENELVSQTVRTYLRDTSDHVVQTMEAVESGRELVNGLVNTYLSVISNRMNEVMKTLTIVASIFVPLTFMAGIYGMNFEHMPELHKQWAYPALLILMTLAAGGMVLYFWRKGWIGRRR